MLRQSCALVLAWAATAAAQCSAAYGDCFNTTCCANGNFGCMRKVGKHFAQCRPMPGGVCQESADWDCPGWERCTEKYATCTETKCCKDAGFACFRKPQADYAQCRPIDSHSACSDTAEWLCPGWQLCSDPYQACTATHCCADRRFTCYQKHPHFAQCMRRGACVAGRDGDCEVTQNLLGQCSAPFHDCHLTGCCQRGEDHCYLKNEFYGQCRPSCSKAELGQDWSCVRRMLPWPPPAPPLPPALPNGTTTEESDSSILGLGLGSTSLAAVGGSATIGLLALVGIGVWVVRRRRSRLRRFTRQVDSVVRAPSSMFDANGSVPKSSLNRMRPVLKRGPEVVRARSTTTASEMTMAEVSALPSAVSAKLEMEEEWTKI